MHDDDRDLVAFRMVAAAVRHHDDARAAVVRLASTLAAPVALTDLRGNVLAMGRATASWRLDALARWRPDAPPPEELDDVHVEPVTVAGDVLALLCTPAGLDHPAIPLALDLVAASLARHQAHAAGRRELVGQVLDDVLRGLVDDREAATRLRNLDVDLDRPHRVVVGEAANGADPSRAIPWNLHALLAGLEEPFLRAVVAGRVVMLVADGPGVTHVASVLHASLARDASTPRPARVGIGRSYSGVAGFRLSYLEAQDALLSGPGVHEASVPDLGRILRVTDLGVPLRELTEGLLRPLRDHDSAHGAQLVATLSTWFDFDCSTARTAERLFVHRNTVRYRLGLIEALTGERLSSFAARAHLWFAVRSLEPAVTPD